MKEPVSVPRNRVEYFAHLVPIFGRDFIRYTGRVLGCGRNSFCDSSRRLDGKTVLITGGNTGLGYVTAQHLWNRGADVVITSRDPSKGEAALAELRSEVREEEGEAGERRGTLRVASLDLASLEAVRRSAKQLLSTLERLDILINNAGLMMPPFGLSEDGFELQFATNHLGHFLFTLLLLPKLLESAPARIVIVSSLGHKFFDNLDLEVMNDPKHYYPLHAYGRSKAANIMFARELAKRLEGTGVNVYALNPGYVSTKLYRHADEGMFPGFHWITVNFMYKIYKTSWEGAQTIIHCAICESVEKDTGNYYEECKVTEVNKTCADEAGCRELWEKSLAWVGLDPDYNIFGSQSRLLPPPPAASGAVPDRAELNGTRLPPDHLFGSTPQISELRMDIQETLEPE